MRIQVTTMGIIALNSMGFSAEMALKTDANLRVGAIQIESEEGIHSSTLALGGSLGIEGEPMEGLRFGTTFYTTQPLFGKDEESMFLSSTNDGYALVGEAFVEAKWGETTLKVGRQRIETPYADSDDVGMVPNTFEGYMLESKEIEDTTVVLASLSRWSGVDSDEPERFNNMEPSGEDVWVAGLLYKGIENLTLQAWHYRLDQNNLTYLETAYETDKFSLAGQYTNQEQGNRAFGFLGTLNWNDFTLTTAYNKAEGKVVNGFGGGPFFTSAEDHTIEIEEFDQEGGRWGVEYNQEQWRVAFSHAHFKVGEDDTDYMVSYAFQPNFTLDVIHSDMYRDGKMTRVFTNYTF